MKGQFFPKFIFSYPMVNEYFGCHAGDRTKNLRWKVGETAQADRKGLLSADYLICDGEVLWFEREWTVERGATHWIYTKC